MERMLLLSICFTLLLVTVRIIYTQDLMYVFYYWNIFLAIVPYCCSRLLKKQQSISFKTSCILAVWLLFFPNAPYIITDIFHFEKRPLIPYWFDLTIVVTGAWNGLLLGILSLMQVEKYLFHLSKWGVDGEKQINAKRAKELPNGMQIKITNPKAMLILGRDNEFTNDQQFDFEIIKRKYANIVDIMTYDDLLQRLENIIAKFKVKP